MHKLMTSPFAIGLVLLASVGTAAAQQLIPVTDDPVLGYSDGFIKPFLGIPLGTRSTSGDAAKSAQQALGNGSLTLNTHDATPIQPPRHPAPTPAHVPHL